ncbi:hypothetical protein ROJ8625_01358 [Roseivivax jejudonensis]|uniref:Uncharacterized protein n=1 Tax=Roseivivax jejudonensis TaxID=1529041 RepID=A0A1X6YTB0_9RHOB|nr:hypothetical protein [Roseivivax jejudonensis]SLN30244.1 hypothetical protein ROJ8625_01358 [Roseivivax jejudonensis]
MTAIAAQTETVLPERASLVLGADLHLTVHALTDLIAVCLPEIDVDGGTPVRTQTGLHVETESFDLRLSVGTLGGSNRLTVELVARDPAETAQACVQARLAKLVWYMLARVPATHVEWLDAAVALPRAAFLSALEPEPTPSRPVAPRRTVAAPLRRTARPARVRRLVRPQRTVPDEQGATHRHDSHVQAFERHLRAEVLRDASPEEVAALRSDNENLAPFPGRTAVSVSIAACVAAIGVFLPL